MTQPSAPPMPQPTAEHARIQENVGTWKVSCQFFMAPGEPPMEVEAKETIEPIGRFWTVSRYECSMMGAPFVGRATVGYEPHTGKYVSTWVDSMSPALCHLTGSRQGDTLTLRGKAWSCMLNAMVEHRMTEKRVHANEFLFEMFTTMPDGRETLVMRNVYRRA